jgi:hypothetical protein
MICCIDGCVQHDQQSANQRARSSNLFFVQSPTNLEAAHPCKHSKCTQVFDCNYLEQIRGLLQRIYYKTTRRAYHLTLSLTLSDGNRNTPTMSTDETTTLASLLGTTSVPEQAFTPSLNATDAGGEPKIVAAVKSALLQARSDTMEMSPAHHAEKTAAKANTAPPAATTSVSPSSPSNASNIITMIILVLGLITMAASLWLCMRCIKKRKLKKQAMAMTPGPGAQQFQMSGAQPY